MASSAGGAKAPLGVHALSTALVKSSSMPTLQRQNGSSHHHGHSQALATTGAMLTLSGSSVGGQWSGRMVAQGHWGLGPQKAGATKKRIPKGIFDKSKTFEVNTTPATQFRRYYERHDLPIAVRHGMQPSVDWKVEPERLDYMFLLPIFFDGLLESEEPYSFLALCGLQDMLNAARGKEPSLIVPAVPSLILPMKRCLNTKDIPTMCKAINMLQLMIRCDPRVGEVLVPYYRQLLPTFNLYSSANKNLGDGIEYSQRKRENMGDLIAETLELLERTGGEDAFINIKYMIPTYESCMIGGH
eukprot:TRINITY_DN5475_c0_g2_i1.p1 TRINITY_DN5475_c0_g2~~TRINITY_DN5475_c0_g2_i1.p1  ORF type:complete len:300 (+),score=56.30 TRINITY_DN5475_c0_g2_i1:45-944(+)